VGGSGSEWGKEYLRIFEKVWIRDHPSNPPLIVFIAPSKPFEAL
jgi:hypothetical protein